MPGTFDAKRFITEFTASMNGKDAERFLALYSENAELKDPSLTQAVRGKQAIRQNFEQWSSAFSELDLNLKDVLRSDSKVALLVEVKARHTGEFAIAPGETIPATNKAVRLDMAQFLTVGSDGKVSKDDTIFDMASMMMQLGLLPGAQATGTSKPQTGAQIGTRR